MSRKQSPLGGDDDDDDDVLASILAVRHRRIRHPMMRQTSGNQATSTHLLLLPAETYTGCWDGMGWDGVRAVGRNIWYNARVSYLHV